MKKPLNSLHYKVSELRNEYPVFFDMYFTGLKVNRFKILRKSEFVKDDLIRIYTFDTIPEGSIISPLNTEEYSYVVLKVEPPTNVGRSLAHSHIITKFDENSPSNDDLFLLKKNVIVKIRGYLTGDKCDCKY